MSPEMRIRKLIAFRRLIDDALLKYGFDPDQLDAWSEKEGESVNSEKTEEMKMESFKRSRRNRGDSSSSSYNDCD